MIIEPLSIHENGKDRPNDTVECVDIVLSHDMENEFKLLKESRNQDIIFKYEYDKSLHYFLYRNVCFLFKREFEDSIDVTITFTDVQDVTIQETRKEKIKKILEEI